jgi:high-affinity iron transporter
VLREGFETAVFLLATFNASGDASTSWLGAVIGILLAAGIGYGVYRGGVRLNLARFFRVTGLILVLVAAGLVMTALHTANEAGWLTFGQAQALDLSWLVRPGTPLAALLTGVLGIQPFPAWIEVVAWLFYLIPMMIIVAWPAGRRLGRDRASADATPRQPAAPESASQPQAQTAQTAQAAAGQSQAPAADQ